MVIHDLDVENLDIQNRLYMWKACPFLDDLPFESDDFPHLCECLHQTMLLHGLICWDLRNCFFWGMIITHLNGKPFSTNCRISFDGLGYLLRLNFDHQTWDNMSRKSGFESVWYPVKISRKIRFQHIATSQKPLNTIL